MVQTSETVARGLGKFAAGLKYEDLPAPVVSRSKQLILDTLGCALGAYSSEPCAIARATVEDLGGKPEATVIGSGAKTTAVNAAWVNGAMIRYLDYNDTYWSPIRHFVHPSNCLAESLAVAERQHLGGRDLIVGYVLGYEVQSRFVDVFHSNGFFHHGIGAFAAPAVAGRLLGLNAEQIANAIGIGGSHNFTIQGVYGEGYVSMMKCMGYAFAQSSGVVAALMAQRGFTGPVTIFESYNRLFENNTSVDLLKGPRSDWALLKSWLKPYEAYHVSHSSISAVLDLARQHGIRAEQVEKVHVRDFHYRDNNYGTRPLVYPQTKEEADHNQHFLLACALTQGAVGPRQFARELWKDAGVKELMRRIEVVGDANLDKQFPARWPVVATITTKDRKTYTKDLDFPKGGPQNPMSDAEVEQKFTDMATEVLPKAQVDQVVRTVSRLETLSDVGQLTALLSPRR